ncbi:MAG TPA: protein translocase subunit SecD [Steroidobacteraceae bacterium]|jgi:preprotein translocase subunit SecD|nr:protein translocase subunit SecD [Steroidobacteraceae bacterium]
MLEYARWKYVLVLVVLALALLLALPNLFGDDPALQVARKDHDPMLANSLPTVEQFLKDEHLGYTSAYLDSGQVIVRFADTADQFKARDAVNAKFADQYITALSFASRAPTALRVLGLRPMKLGLDLRGGLYLLYQVDTQSAIAQLLDSYAQDLRRALSEAKIPYSEVAPVASVGNVVDGLRLTLAPGANVDAAQTVAEKALPDLPFKTVTLANGVALQGTLSSKAIRDRQDYAIEQNLVTLRNRVSQLGVAEPIVQRQSGDRINVQLPGVLNSAEVKDLLSKVASLEFRLNATTGDPYEVAQHGNAPVGTKLYYDNQHQPLLLKREIIATGDELASATAANDQDGPIVNIKLDSRAGDRMLATTQANLGRHMAVVYIEKHRETTDVGGKKVTRDVTDEKVINDATIQGVFGNAFRISGLTGGESRDLALLIRSGSLSTPIYPVDERTIGPSLGKENITRGVNALEIGMGAVFLFMFAYYKVFGLVADAVLLANVVLLTALLSLMGAVLSLPGIAGIILTVGIAVDANVLIYERIREELRNGVSPQAAIRAGFEKAFSAIWDSNVTTFIAGVVLWALGTGAIKNFAVVLTLGIATSMFTSLMGSRALITLMYGGRRKLTHLPI